MSLGLPLLHDRTLRVFVSSTFEDLKRERELLATHVFPSLRATCSGLGIAFVDVDLRWGVDEESVAQNRILELCLGEVDRATLVVILLGARYGTVLGTAPRQLLVQYPWLAQAGDVSATEAEVIHALDRRASGGCECFA